MAARPTQVPRIATDALTCIEPAESGSAGVTTKNTGVIPDTRTPAQYMNWWLNNIYGWCLYLQDISNQNFTAAGVGAWTGAQEFDNTVYFQPLVSGTPIVTQANSGSNSGGAVFAGNGSGFGSTSNAGVTGIGGLFFGGISSGDGLHATARGGSSNGVVGQGFGGGFGGAFNGGTSGTGLLSSGNGVGLGGAFYGGANGIGVQAIAGGGNNQGGLFYGSGTSAGVEGSGASGPGVKGTGGSNGNGCTGFGNGTGSGCSGTGAAGTSGNGVTGIALGSGAGGSFVNIAGNGFALRVLGNAVSPSAMFLGTGPQPGIAVQSTAHRPAIDILEGFLQLDGTDPAINADPGAANALNGAQITKAWGSVTLDGAGGIVTNDGINLSAVTIVAAHAHVTFARSMLSNVYAVTFGTSGATIWLHAQSFNKTATGFDVSIWSIGGGGLVSLMNAATQAGTWDFEVKSRQ